MPTIRSKNKRMLVLFFNFIILSYPHITPHCYLPTLFTPSRGHYLLL